MGMLLPGEQFGQTLADTFGALTADESSMIQEKP